MDFKRFREIAVVAPYYCDISILQELLLRDILNRIYAHICSYCKLQTTHKDIGGTKRRSYFNGGGFDNPFGYGS